METLLRWYALHGRDLPWRRTTDPYRIVVSEVMLQQTQVDRVVPKYEHWLRMFPDWKTLATARKAEVLKAWSGLGYNSRAIRLQLLARVVAEQGFPDTEASLRKMPGIGPYTAGAIMAFAFDKPGHFIDVNVERVLKRYYFTKRQRPDKERVTKKLLELQKTHSPRALGNALMDLGSLFCTATNPDCTGCPLSKTCKSRGERPEEHRVRAKKRQGTFLHSNRWWRGQILKQLVQQELDAQTIFKQIGVPNEQEFLAALAELQKEGVVSRGKILNIKG